MNTSDQYYFHTMTQSSRERRIILELLVNSFCFGRVLTWFLVLTAYHVTHGQLGEVTGHDCVTSWLSAYCSGFSGFILQSLNNIVYRYKDQFSACIFSHSKGAVTMSFACCKRGLIHLFEHTKNFLERPFRQPIHNVRSTGYMDGRQ